MPGLDAPRPTGDRLGCVEHRQVDFRRARRRGRAAAPGTASARGRRRLTRAARSSGVRARVARARTPRRVRAWRPRSCGFAERAVGERDGGQRRDRAEPPRGSMIRPRVAPRLSSASRASTPRRRHRGLATAAASSDSNARRSSTNARAAVLDSLALDREPGADTPGKLRLLRIERGRHPTDLPQRHPSLEVALQSATRLRGLARVDAVEKERLCEVVALRVQEQPRPQVVVLALEVLGVVAQPVRLEHVSVDEDARMEERGAEEGGPANLRSSRSASRGACPACPTRRAQSPRFRRRRRASPTPCAGAAVRAVSGTRRRRRRAVRRTVLELPPGRG